MTWPDDDRSNGWEQVAGALIDGRSEIGVTTLRAWVRGLPAAASVLDVGCGSGVPVTRTLVEAGCQVAAIDASPSLVAAFRRRFPGLPVACEAAETSPFFGRRFDAAVAIGLIFLLPADRQPFVLRRVAAALRPHGRFLFTAPLETGSWSDALTGRPSVSLGDAGYRRAIADAGLDVVGEHMDEGANHYYDTVNRRDE